MALSSLKCNGTISFVYVKSGGRIMQISGRSDSLCIFLYEMDFSIFAIGLYLMHLFCKQIKCTDI